MRSIDADLRNADWPKRTWDVYRRGALVDSLAELRRVLDDDSIRRLPTLPVWDAVPERLRDEIQAWEA